MSLPLLPALVMLLPAPAGAAATVAAYPGPAFGHASPVTEITLVGVGADELDGLAVVGARSGRHDGALRPLRAERGVVFSPAEPFAAGERVRVDVGHPVRGAGGASSYTFRTSEPVAGSWKSPDAPPLLMRVHHDACRLRRAVLRTIDAPAPVGRCMVRAGGAPPRGRLLVSPRPPTGATLARPALMVLSGGGQILWYQPREGVVHDLNMQRYRGEPVLTYYLRAVSGPWRHEIVDRHYRVVGRVVPGNGYGANAHELQLTGRDTAYAGMYVPVRLHGSRIKITDFVVQEIDVPTGDVLFEWHALDHVPRSGSYVPRPRTGWSWDFFHGNSIEPPASGGRTLIVSARKTSAVYGIDRVTGRVRWVLGGRKDQFGLGAGRRFCAQHDARRLPGGDLSVFDNGGTQLPRGLRQASGARDALPARHRAQARTARPGRRLAQLVRRRRRVLAQRRGQRPLGARRRRARELGQHRPYHAGRPERPRALQAAARHLELPRRARRLEGPADRASRGRRRAVRCRDRRLGELERRDPRATVAHPGRPGARPPARHRRDGGLRQGSRRGWGCAPTRASSRSRPSATAAGSWRPRRRSPSPISAVGADACPGVRVRSPTRAAQDATGATSASNPSATRRRSGSRWPQSTSRRIARRQEPSEATISSITGSGRTSPATTARSIAIARRSPSTSRSRSPGVAQIAAIRSAIRS